MGRYFWTSSTVSTPGADPSFITLKVSWAMQVVPDPADPNLSAIWSIREVVS